MNSITVRDKEFVSYLTEDQIQQRVKALANALTADYQDKNPLFIGVLNGSFMFVADLMKELSIECEVAFIRLSSYTGMESTGNVKQVLGLQDNVFGRHIVLLEDIVDSGLTMEQTLAFFEDRGPKSVEIATLLLKPENLEKELRLKYVGFEIPEKFVVGYGLDYDGHGRNLKDIYQLKKV
ncbi:MAG: hypoxanthine phosphoribosyltransferase [Roseivirga sp.]